MGKQKEKIKQAAASPTLTSIRISLWQGFLILDA
jgi:hypothetical protein